MTGKRIWLLNHYAVTPDIGGGTRHYDFGEELAKRGYDVTIYASSFDHKLRKEKLDNKEKYRRKRVDGFSFVWIRTYHYQKNDYKRVLNMLSFAIRLFFTGIQEKSVPDIIIASSVHPFTCLTGYFLARIKKAKYIVEIRDLWPQTAVDMGLMNDKSIQVRLLRLLERFIYKKAEKIIVLLPGAVNYIKNMGIAPEKVVYIPNGVTVKRNQCLVDLKKPSHSVEEILQYHRDAFTVIYLGAHGKANGLKTIIKSAGLLWNRGFHDIHFLMVGDGPEKKDLIQYVQECNIENVFFYDSIKKADVPLLLDRIDICIFHLVKTEVFKYGISPNKLFDYLCAGKPIVFACNSSNNIVNKSNSGLSVSPEAPEEIAQALIKLYEMGAGMRAVLGMNGKCFVQKYHDIPILVDKLETIL